jgi:hypothetical protein
LDRLGKLGRNVNLAFGIRFLETRREKWDERLEKSWVYAASDSKGHTCYSRMAPSAIDGEKLAVGVQLLDKYCENWLPTRLRKLYNITRFQKETDSDQLVCLIVVDVGSHYTFRLIVCLGGRGKLR